MKLFLDNVSVYSITETHLDMLQKCFTKCRENGISFNPKSVFFFFLFNQVLFLVKWFLFESKFSNSEKVEALVMMPRPRNIKVIQIFNG